MDTTIIEPPVKRKKSVEDEDEEEMIDNFCDPNSPKVLSFQDVSAAAYKIKSGIQHTPCTVSYSIACMRMVFKQKVFTVFNLITAHTPISAQSSNSIVFRLQPVYFMSTSL